MFMLLFSFAVNAGCGCQTAKTLPAQTVEAEPQAEQDQSEEVKEPQEEPGAEQEQPEELNNIEIEIKEQQAEPEIQEQVEVMEEKGKTFLQRIIDYIMKLFSVK